MAYPCWLSNKPAQGPQQGVCHHVKTCSTKRSDENDTLSLSLDELARHGAKYLCNGEAEDEDDEGKWEPRDGEGHGVQTDAGSLGEVAEDQGMRGDREFIGQGSLQRRQKGEGCPRLTGCGMNPIHNFLEYLICFDQRHFFDPWQK